MMGPIWCMKKRCLFVILPLHLQTFIMHIHTYIYIHMLYLAGFTYATEIYLRWFNLVVLDCLFGASTKPGRQGTGKQSQFEGLLR